MTKSKNSAWSYAQVVAAAKFADEQSAWWYFKSIETLPTSVVEEHDDHVVLEVPVYAVAADKGRSDLPEGVIHHSAVIRVSNKQTWLDKRTNSRRWRVRTYEHIVTYSRGFTRPT